MNPKSGDLVLMDTTSIIEAHRVGCWAAVVARFRIETVEECEAEACTRSRRQTPADYIDVGRLRDSLRASHPIDKPQRALLAARAGILGVPMPDPGERDLWSHVLASSFEHPRVLT